MTDNKSFLDKVHEHLFVDEDYQLSVFDADELQMLKRYKDVYSQMLDNPWKPDQMLVTYIKTTYGVSKSTAYKDLSNVKVLLSNVKSADKEFQRYSANQMIREGYKLAKDAGSLTEIKQAEAMIRAAQALVKVNLLDKEEQFKIDPDDVKVDEFEATTDITVIKGFKKKYSSDEELEAHKARLRKKYGAEPNVVDVDFTDVSNHE